MALIERGKNAAFVPYEQMSTDGGAGPLGILPSFFAAFDEQSMLYSPFGYEEELRDVEDENLRKAREAGINIEPLDMVGDGQYARNLGPTLYEQYAPYTEFQRASYDADTAIDVPSSQGLREKARQLLGERDKQLAEARARRPDLGIMSYDEMRAEVSRRGKERYDAWSGARGSFWGNVSGFVGGALGASDPRTNPYWMLNLGGAGVGRTALMRILTSAGYGIGSETVQQLTGARETQQWFGLDPTWQQTAFQIGVAGAFPGIVQTGLEGVTKAIARSPRALRAEQARREAAFIGPRVPRGWEPPPERLPVEPGSSFPEGLPRGPDAVAWTATTEILDRNVPAGNPILRTRLAVDLDHTARQADLWGTAPADVVPPSAPLRPATSVNPDIGRWLGPGADDIAVSLPRAWTKASRGADDHLSPLERARKADPEVVDTYKKLSKQIDQAERDIKRATALEKERTSESRFGTPELDRMLQEKQAELTRTRTDTGYARVLKEIDELKEMQRGERPVPPGFTAERHATKLADLLARRKALEPAIERAYARASQQWELDKAQLDELYRSLGPIKDSKKKVKATVTQTKGPPAQRAFAEQTPDIPELRHPVAQSGGKANEPAIDKVVRVQEARAKDLPEGLEQFAKTIQKWADEAEAVRMAAVKGEAVEIATMADGTPISELANQKFSLGPGQEPMTLREFLDDFGGDTEALAAVATCRIA